MASPWLICCHRPGIALHGCPMFSVFCETHHAGGWGRNPCSALQSCVAAGARSALASFWMCSSPCCQSMPPPTPLLCRCCVSAWRWSAWCKHTLNDVHFPCSEILGGARCQLCTYISRARAIGTESVLWECATSWPTDDLEKGWAQMLLYRAAQRVQPLGWAWKMPGPGYLGITSEYKRVTTQGRWQDPVRKRVGQAVYGGAKLQTGFKKQDRWLPTSRLWQGQPEAEQAHVQRGVERAGGPVHRNNGSAL